MNTLIVDHTDAVARADPELIPEARYIAHIVQRRDIHGFHVPDVLSQVTMIEDGIRGANINRSRQERIRQDRINILDTGLGVINERHQLAATKNEKIRFIGQTVKQSVSAGEHPFHVCIDNLRILQRVEFQPFVKHRNACSGANVDPAPGVLGDGTDLGRAKSIRCVPPPQLASV